MSNTAMQPYFTPFVEKRSYLTVFIGVLVYAENKAFNLRIVTIAISIWFSGFGIGVGICSPMVLVLVLVVLVVLVLLLVVQQAQVQVSLEGPLEIEVLGVDSLVCSLSINE